MENLLQQILSELKAQGQKINALEAKIGDSNSVKVPSNRKINKRNAGLIEYYYSLKKDFPALAPIFLSQLKNKKLWIE